MAAAWLAAGMDIATVAAPHENAIRSEISIVEVLPSVVSWICDLCIYWGLKLQQ